MTVSSFFPQQALDWQALQPDLAITEFPSETVDFWSLQPNAKQALSVFLRHPSRFLLMLKADDQAEYASLLESFTKLHHREQSVFGVNYVVEQGDAFSFPRVYTEVAHSLDDNFATPGEVVNALYCDNFNCLVLFVFILVRMIFN